MAQTFATLLFLMAAAAGMTVIAASLIDDWAAMTQALGFGSPQIAPLPRNRSVNVRQARTVRVTRPLNGKRAVAA